MSSITLNYPLSTGEIWQYDLKLWMNASRAFSKGVVVNGRSSFDSSTYKIDLSGSPENLEEVVGMFFDEMGIPRSVNGNYRVIEKAIAPKDLRLERDLFSLLGGGRNVVKNYE
jgi:hypothetical protein